MIETKEITIDGSKYTVTQMPARRALRMKAKLLRTFGTALAEIYIPNEEENIEGLNFSRTQAIKAVESLACKLDDDDKFEKICVEILQGVRKEGIELTESIIDLEFAGNLR